jgi:hypothetical protein
MVNLLDTFFYAGSDLVMQVMYHSIGVQPQATPLKHIPAPTTKQSIYTEAGDISYGYNIFNDASDFESGINTTVRPWIQFYETQNLPLMSDCGVSGLIYPSFATPCNIGTDSVVVWLKNYGVYSLSAVRLWYRIDNQPPVSYDWTGVLNAGDSVRAPERQPELYSGLSYHPCLG